MWKGIFYNAISKYSGVLINIIITAVLARVLTPSEFGIVALVFVFTGFFNLLGNLGIGPAIVQARELSGEDIGSIFSFSSIMSFLLAVLFYLFAGFIAQFYNEPELIPLVQFLSLSVFFNILSIVPKALNKKELRFKQMGLVNVSVQAITGAIAIIMALQGYSYYSLVVQNVLTGILGFIIFYYLYPIQIIFKIKKAPLKRIASFSTYQFAYNFISYFSRNLDNLFIGKFLGNASLGYYNKSYTLMQLPVYNLTHVITPVLHPVLAQHQDEKGYIYKSYTQILRILAGIGFPLSIFLYFSATELVLILFGSQWELSIPVFKLLALTVGLQICLTSSGAIYQASNRTDLLFRAGFVSSFFMISGIAYGVFFTHSLEGVGYGLIVAFMLNFFLEYYLLITIALHEPFLNFLKLFLMPLISSITAFIIYYIISQFNFENLILSLALKTIILCVVVLLFFFIPRENRLFIKNFLKRQ